MSQRNATLLVMAFLAGVLLLCYEGVDIRVKHDVKVDAKAAVDAAVNGVHEVQRTKERPGARRRQLRFRRDTDS